MITNEVNAKLEALMQDEIFMEALSTKKNVDEVVALLAENGVEMTADEVRECMDGGRKLLEDRGIMNAEGELTEKGLEMVAGGFKLGRFILGAVIGGASAYFGFVPGVVFGAGLIILSFR